MQSTVKNKNRKPITNNIFSYFLNYYIININYNNNNNIFNTNNNIFNISNNIKLA
jgi:hypothetical protein